MLIKATYNDYIEDFAKKVIANQKENPTQIITAEFKGFVILVDKNTTVESFVKDYDFQWDVAINDYKYIQKFKI
ncbi:MAG: hypothetical protein PHT02_01245 [Tissierellia bacterium]|nr:hypothetical protein [Tissierellia bacterium]